MAGGRACRRRRLIVPASYRAGASLCWDLQQHEALDKFVRAKARKKDALVARGLARSHRERGRRDLKQAGEQPKEGLVGKAVLSASADTDLERVAIEGTRLLAASTRLYVDTQQGAVPGRAHQTGSVGPCYRHRPSLSHH